MTTADDAFRELQRKARSDAARTGMPVPTGEYLTRHGLESFLGRLMHTPHADDFVLKGGILLAVYGARRPTKDVDSAAISASVTAENVAQVVHDVAAVPAADGVSFDTSSIAVQDIREGGDYPGLRMRVRAQIGEHVVTVAWDVSAGDPIVPLPVRVQIPRLLGEPIEMMGYAPETAVAEKGVTILERGVSSTRWRDYVDIVQLARRHGLDQDALRQAALAVARYRRIELRPVGTAVDGYGSVGQAKWSAWRRKERLEAISEADLDAQMVAVAAILDPVFVEGSPQ